MNCRRLAAGNVFKPFYDNIMNMLTFEDEGDVTVHSCCSETEWGNVGGQSKGNLMVKILGQSTHSLKSLSAPSSISVFTNLTALGS